MSTAGGEPPWQPCLDSIAAAAVLQPPGADALKGLKDEFSNNCKTNCCFVFFLGAAAMLRGLMPPKKMWFAGLFEHVQTSFSTSLHLYLSNGLGRKGTSAFNQVKKLLYCAGWSRQEDTDTDLSLSFLCAVQILRYIVWETYNTETNIQDLLFHLFSMDY